MPTPGVHAPRKDGQSRAGVSPPCASSHRKATAAQGGKAALRVHAPRVDARARGAQGRRTLAGRSGRIGHRGPPMNHNAMARHVGAV